MTYNHFSVVAVIPAHLASVRFPGKILTDICGLPMIEHIRRRAMMCPSLDRVVVATCDEEIATAIQGFGGHVRMTSNVHSNGTSRVAEAVTSLDCTHVLLLQGDEPLLIPDHVEHIIASMRTETNAYAWNATSTLTHEDELDRHSFVKCTVTPSDRILYCFRRSPFFTDFSNQVQVVRKILGLIAYRKDFLIRMANATPTSVELYESIEQMRIIESGFSLKSVPVFPSLPSVNEPNDLQIVLDCLKSDPIQSSLLHRVLAHPGA